MYDCACVCVIVCNHVRAAAPIPYSFKLNNKRPPCRWNVSAAAVPAGQQLSYQVANSSNSCRAQRATAPGLQNVTVKSSQVKLQAYGNHTAIPIRACPLLSHYMQL